MARLGRLRPNVTIIIRTPLPQSLVLTDDSGGVRLGRTTDTLAIGVVLTDTAGATRAASVLGETVGNGIALADVPDGARAGSTTDTIAIGVLLSDTAGSLRAAGDAGDALLIGTAQSARQPIVVSDTDRAYFARLRYDTATIIAPPAEAPLDLVLTDTADAIRLGRTTDTAAVGLTLADTAGSQRAGSTFGETVANGTVLTDTPGSLRAGTAGTTVAIGVALADTPGAARLASTSDIVRIDVILTDTATGLRAGSTPGETVSNGTSLTDSPPVGLRLGQHADSLAAGVALSDVVGSTRLGSTLDYLAVGLVLTDPQRGSQTAGNLYGEQTATDLMVLTDSAPGSLRAASTTGVLVGAGTATAGHYRGGRISTAWHGGRVEV